jgi:hypothetical protein
MCENYRKEVHVTSIDKPAEPIKKRYCAPELQVYGDLRHIVKLIGVAGGGDSNNPNHAVTNA